MMEMPISNTIHNFTDRGLPLCIPQKCNRVPKSVEAHLIFNRTRNEFKKRSRKVDGFSQRLQSDALGAALGLASENEEVVADLWERFAATKEALR